MESKLLEPYPEPLNIGEIRKMRPDVAQVIDNFIALDKQKAIVKEFFDKYEQSVRDVKELVKIGFHFQDDDGTVYEMDEMQWKSVRVTPYEVKRTRREG